MTGTEMIVQLILDGTLVVHEDGSVWRVVAMGKPCEPRRIDRPNYKGYMAITVGIPGTKKTTSAVAHLVVWIVNKGPIPDGLQINHKDLNKANNKLDNLEVVNASENILHSYANGRPSAWHKSTHWRGKPIITHEQMCEIRKLRSEGKKLREIGTQFNIGDSHVSRICRKKGGVK